jgi:cell division cycle 14
MIVHGKSPEESYVPLVGKGASYVPYRDAGYGAATYHITILDCLKGLHKAMTIGLLDLQNFNVDKYEFYERVENGDFNWITPKFLALACPKEEMPLNFPQIPKNTKGKFYSACEIDNLIRFMLENDIKVIIRLNNKVVSYI